MTTLHPDEPGRTSPIELAAAADPSPEPFANQADDHSVPTSRVGAVVARAATPMQQEVLYVPLAVNIGDGFKFGCGFFLAAVLAMLVGFVLLAALFVLTGLLGLNLPITR